MEDSVVEQITKSTIFLQLVEKSIQHKRLTNKFICGKLKESISIKDILIAMDDSGQAELDLDFELEGRMLNFNITIEKKKINEENGNN